MSGEASFSHSSTFARRALMEFTLNVAIIVMAGCLSCFVVASVAISGRHRSMYPFNGTVPVSQWDESR